jgi:hypothetical protein
MLSWPNVSFLENVSNRWLCGYLPNLNISEFALTVLIHRFLRQPVVASRKMGGWKALSLSLSKNQLNLES